MTCCQPSCEKCGGCGWLGVGAAVIGSVGDRDSAWSDSSFGVAMNRERSLDHNRCVRLV